MKKLVIALAVMAALTVSASAAESTHGASAGMPSTATMIEAPTGYLYPEMPVEAPDGYAEGESEIGEPLVAYTLDYLDELALEKGWVVVETGGGKYRDYVRTVDGYRTMICLEADFATVCVHGSDPEMPGAIMGMQCYIDIDAAVVYSTVDIAALFQ